MRARGPQADKCLLESSRHPSYRTDITCRGATARPWMCPLAVVYWYQWLQRNLGFYWELVLSQVPTALMGLQYARPTRIEGTATRTQWSGLGAEDVRGPGLFEARNRRMTLRHQILLNPSTMMSIARQLLRYRENTHDSRLAERIIIGLWRNTTFLKGILQGYKACSTVAL